MRRIGHRIGVCRSGDLLRSLQRPQGLRLSFGNSGKARFLVATPDALQAAPIIVRTGEPAMAFGGFLGNDPVMSVEAFAKRVENGDVRFVVLGTARRSRGFETWVRAHGVPVDPALWRSLPAEPDRSIVLSSYGSITGSNYRSEADFNRDGDFDGEIEAVLAAANLASPDRDLRAEAIEALANALYKIPKTCEKIGERLAICPSQFSVDIVDKQVRMLEQATEVTARLVRKLRKLSNVEEIQDEYETLQTIEGDADRLMVGLLRDLYQGNVDAKEVVVLKDIYELLERAIDHCRDAGKVVFQIALKYA